MNPPGPQQLYVSLDLGPQQLDFHSSSISTAARFLSAPQLRQQTSGLSFVTAKVAASDEVD